MKMTCDFLISTLGIPFFYLVKIVVTMVYEQMYRFIKCLKLLNSSSSDEEKHQYYK